MVIFSIIALLKYKMSMSGVITIFIVSLLGTLLFSDCLLYMYFFSFLILGIVKLINKHYTKETDIDKYSVKNFMYAGGIPFVLSIFVFILDKYNYNSDVILFLNMITFVNLGTLLIDTASGELGQSFKTKTYLITSFKEVKSGTDGGISISGTVLGLITCIIYVSMIVLLCNISVIYAFLVLLFSFIGNLLDSIIGATLQNKNYVNNEQTNFISMFIVTVFSTLVFYFLILI